MYKRSVRNCGKKGIVYRSSKLDRIENMNKLLLLLCFFTSQMTWAQFGAPSYEELITTKIIPEYSSWDNDTQRILVKTTIADGFSYYWNICTWC